MILAFVPISECFGMGQIYLSVAIEHPCTKCQCGQRTLASVNGSKHIFRKNVQCKIEPTHKRGQYLSKLSFSREEGLNNVSSHLLSCSLSA
jgi:hypothetical protein